MNVSTCSTSRILVFIVTVVTASVSWDFVQAADWPQWRCDAARTATSSEVLPAQLHLQWVREFPPLKPAFWQVRQERLQFDLGYEPVVLGRTMFVASSQNDSVTALDAETGAQKWRFYADGPVRLAPAAWEQKVYVASDDGCLYCLAAGTGELLWKVRGAPSARKVIGNDRLISVWPARGAPVIHEGRVYFSAGIWPFEGIFVHALDARTGKPLWVNDRLSFLYAEHPHGAMSFGGPSPQGYLLIRQRQLVLPGSRAFPAFLDLASGELVSLDFGHGGHGSRPGSWFIATEADGQLVVDPNVNSEMHDAGVQTIGQSGIRRMPGEALQPTVTIGQETYHIKTGVATSIRVGAREFHFEDGFPGVEGAVHTMLATHQRLFVVTRNGRIYCFGANRIEPQRYPLQRQPLDQPDDGWKSRAASLLHTTGQTAGYAIVWGLGTGRLAEELAAQSRLRVIVVDRDGERITTYRRRLDAAGIYGQKIVAHVGDPADFGWPPYLASLIASESTDWSEKSLKSAFAALRPYGGTLCLRLPVEQRASLGNLMRQPEMAGGQLRQEGELSLVVLSGELPRRNELHGQAELRPARPIAAGASMVRRHVPPSQAPLSRRNPGIGTRIALLPACREWRDELPRHRALRPNADKIELHPDPGEL